MCVCKVWKVCRHRQITLYAFTRETEYYYNIVARELTKKNNNVKPSVIKLHFELVLTRDNCVG